MRSTSFFLNPQESKSRELYVVRLIDEKTSLNDWRRRGSGIHFFLIIKKEQTINIMGSSQSNYHLFDLGMEVLHVNGIGKKTSFKYPLKESFVDALNSKFTAYDFRNLSSNWFVRNIHSDFETNGLMEKIKSIRSEYESLISNSMHPNHKKELLIRLVNKHLADYLDTEMLLIGEPC